jgi:hypothetical protein
LKGTQTLFVITLTGHHNVTRHNPTALASTVMRELVPSAAFQLRLPSRDLVRVNNIAVHRNLKSGARFLHRKAPQATAKALAGQRNGTNLSLSPISAHQR